MGNEVGQIKASPNINIEFKTLLQQLLYKEVKEV